MVRIGEMALRRLWQSFILIVAGLMATPALADAQSDTVHLYLSGQSTELAGVGDPLVTAMLARAEAFLVRAGYAPERIELPLGRTLQRVAEDPHGLVFGVRRRDSKEAGYHWILQLTTPQKLALYARTGDPEAIKDGLLPPKGLIACYLRSYECEYMLGLGVPASQLMAVPQGAQGQIERMLISGRVRYVVQAPGFALGNIKRLGYDPGILKPIWVRDSSAIYMVADIRTADPAFIARLKATSQEGLPPLAVD